MPAAAGQAQKWMLTVRLLEVAGLALLLGVVFDFWAAYQSTTQSPDPSTGILDPSDLSWTQLALAALFYSFRGPFSLVAMLVLLLAALAILRLGWAGYHRRFLKWEAALLTVLASASVVAYLAAALVLLVNPPTGVFGPQGVVVQVLGGMSWPLAAAALAALFFFWWWPLRLDDDSEDSGAEEVEHAKGVEDVGDPRPQSAFERDRAAGWGTWSAEGAAPEGALANAERIDPADWADPAERSTPGASRVSPDGSTENGYDEFFRRA